MCLRSIFIPYRRAAAHGVCFVNRTQMTLKKPIYADEKDKGVSIFG